MAAWAGLESWAMADAEKPSFQGSWRRTPHSRHRLCRTGGQLLRLGSPRRAGGAAVPRGAERWQHCTASGQSGAAGEARPEGVCVCARARPPRLSVGTTALTGPHGRCGSCGLDPE